MITEYFWRQQDDIPKGMGYPLFGTAHILSVSVTIFLVLVFLFLIRRSKDSFQRKVLRSIPLLMIFLEIFKDVFLMTQHRFGIGYLPLHICSMGIFVFFFREYIKKESVKEFFGEVAYILIMPGALAALIFADWTVYYPVLNFINLHSYLWHGLLILYPLLLKLRKDISPDIRHIYRVILFLCVIVPPVYIFDKCFNCNYFFINWPIKNSPLSWLSSFMGVPGYLMGYALLTLIAISTVYLITWLCDKMIR